MGQLLGAVEDHNLGRIQQEGAVLERQLITEDEKVMSADTISTDSGTVGSEDINTGDDTIIPDLPDEGPGPQTLEAMDTDDDSSTSDDSSGSDDSTNGDTVVVDPVLPAECPGGCPPSATCQNGTCVVDGEPMDGKKITITENGESDDSGSGNGESQNGAGSGSGSKVVKAKGQNIIDKITTTVKNTDNKVLYGVGGGIALITLISILQN
ncbi:hypothetical protein LX73_2339 [Fodinibius salinus]|uniref:Uncharacterized protein n=1 Tax=Fodinibius salinus TaxID=860790 RepID=A0A5D3YK36_9BACT|nr:hypothetical protein [Fodinibius salinus]TYP92092.1 hypothetical protein LX73_2339 [Fodinibius salinus]